MYKLTAHVFPGCRFKTVANENQEVTMEIEQDETVSVTAKVTYCRFTSEESFGVSICDKNNNLIAVFHARRG